MNPAYWAAGIAALATFVNLVSLLIAAVRLNRPRRPGLDPALAAEPVSIVRPVRGVETFSEETLRSAFRLDHPDFEILFCVADEDDPIIPLVRRLMAEHPAVPSRLFVGDERISANPKLNNCVRGWNAARHEWVVLADSNLLLPPNYLARLMASWRPDTGLVCSTPAGSRPSGFWAEVECAFLNSLQARWQYTGEAVGLGFAQGKSLLWRRSLLEAHGGIRALAAETAEDAAATKIVRGAGLHVHLVDRPFEQPLGHRTAGEVWDRQLRWARLRRVTFPVFFLPELFSGPVMSLLLGTAAAASLGWPALPVFAVILGLWWVPEIALARSVGWHLSRWTIPAFAARDLLVPPMYCAAWFAQDIVWRGNAMTIRTKAGELAAERGRG